jgi:hypothetical protein
LGKTKGLKMDKKSFDQIIAELRASKKHNTSDRRVRNPEWYEANNRRFKDPKYTERLSESITQFYKDNPDFQKEKVNSNQWKKAHQKGVDNYINSPDYVNPRGMLGKTRSEETCLKSSLALKGQNKPLEGNRKISEQRLGKSPKQESIDKMRNALTGRTSDRRRQVQTPAGTFNSLFEAAEYYEVSTSSIKNFIKGQNVKDWFKPKLVAKGITFDRLKPLGFAWLGDFDNQLKAKRIQTPDAIFENASEAAIYYKITPAAIRERIKVRKDWNYL